MSVKHADAFCSILIPRGVPLPGGSLPEVLPRQGYVHLVQGIHNTMLSYSASSILGEKGLVMGYWNSRLVFSVELNVKF